MGLGSPSYMHLHPSYRIGLRSLPPLLVRRRHPHVRPWPQSLSAAGGLAADRLQTSHNHHEETHHHHSHGHDHDHDHDHEHYEESAVSRLLASMGLVRLGNSLAHSGRWTAVSIACFVIALLSGAEGMLARAVGHAASDAMRTVALAGTFLLSGLPQTVEALCIAGSGKVDTHVLMSLAVVGTVFMGMAQEGALLLLLFQVSHTLEELFSARARGSLERLFASIPTQATLVEVDVATGGPLMQSAAAALAKSVRPGQHVLVKPGEQVPLDGQVTWGSASVSMAHITGESQPVRVLVGSTVPAGSLNADGLLVVRVTATADDSTPARIARMTLAAQGSKPKLKRMLDHVGEVWSKAVIGVTLAVLVALPLLGVPLLGPRGALYRAMGVLTAGSPCAVVLVPLAYVCAVATVTRRGVLMKSSAALDLLHQCGTVALDKTGTLTTGSLTLTDVRMMLSPDSAPPDTQQQAGSTTTAIASSSASSAAMQYCLSLSVSSNHPVSRAVVAAGGALEGQQLHQVSMFEQVPGLGIQGVCQLHPEAEPVMVRFGSLEFIQLSVPCGGQAARELERAEEMQKRDSSFKAMSFLTATDHRPTTSAATSNGAQSLDAAQRQGQQGQHREPGILAMFCFEDMIAPGAPQAVAALKSGTWRGAGKRVSDRDAKEVVMLTGDGQQVARHVALQLSIDRVHAALKPDEKLAYITSFRSDSGNGGGAAAATASNVARPGLLFMGDGINDAPALAGAHVGVAVASTPSDMVAAAADIIVLNGAGVSNLPWLFKVAHRTATVVNQNLALALVSVVFATLPTLAGVFPLWLAVLLHEGATVLVVLNSLRLLLDPDTASPAAALASSVEAIRDMFAEQRQHDHGHHDHEHGHHDHSHGHHDHGHGHHDHQHHHSHEEDHHHSHSHAGLAHSHSDNHRHADHASAHSHADNHNHSHAGRGRSHSHHKHHHEFGQHREHGNDHHEEGHAHGGHAHGEHNNGPSDEHQHRQHASSQQESVPAMRGSVKP